MIDYIIEIVKHLLITEVVEIGIAYLIGIREKKNLILILIVNAITNITLNMFLIFVVIDIALYLSGNTGIDLGASFYIIVIVFEIIIVFMEAFAYYKMIKPNTICTFYKLKSKFASYFLLSLTLNIGSVLVGRLFD